jgi:hypothetical protein
MTICAASDDETCPLCRHLDQKTIDINDRDLLLFVPPLHDGCRCVAAYNMQSMRSEFRKVDYVRPPREMIEGHLATQRLVRGEQAARETPTKGERRKMKYCPNCKQNVEPIRHIRHGLHIFLSIVTGGAWFILVYLWILLFGAKRCPKCNTKALSPEQ